MNEIIYFMNFQIRIIRYQAQYQMLWNQFVAQAENATFLFDRNFMDYHADRFTDHSLILFADNELLAILPANEKDDTIYSHQGLTYGGLAFRKTANFTREIFQVCLSSILKYYREQEFKTLIYKEIPFFYQTSNVGKISFSNESASLFQKDTGAVIDLQSNFHFSYLRKRSIKKAKGNKLSIIESIENQIVELKTFWEKLLVPNLRNKYSLQPTHTIEEITLLASRFPQNIKFYAVYGQNEMLAGTVVFEDRQVAHCQYIASNDLGKEIKATDLLFNFLIKEVYQNFRYFSFGISNWHGTDKINEGLLAWKQSWGAKICTHFHYKINM